MFLCIQDNAFHRSNRFKWIFTICRFVTQHNRVCTLYDGVCDITHFSTSRFWRINHAGHHLRRDD